MHLQINLYEECELVTQISTLPQNASCLQQFIVGLLKRSPCGLKCFNRLGLSLDKPLTKMTDNVNTAGGTADLSLSDSKYMKFTLCDWFSLKH